MRENSAEEKRRGRTSGCIDSGKKGGRKVEEGPQERSGRRRSAGVLKNRNDDWGGWDRKNGTAKQKEDSTSAMILTKKKTCRGRYMSGKIPHARQGE